MCRSCTLTAAWWTTAPPVDEPDQIHQGHGRLRAMSHLLAAVDSQHPADPIALAAALATAPAGTVLSHRTAAQLFGLWIPPFTGIEVTTRTTWRGSSYTTGVQRRSAVAHRRVLDPSDTTREQGLPVTCVARTWLDLAPLLDIYDLVAAGDSALRLGCDRQELEQRVASANRVRGLRKARTAFALLNGRARSRPESRIRCALRLAGLPEPRVNEGIYDSTGGWLAEPDLHYREARVAIEFNGRDHADAVQMRKDATRLLTIQREKWEVRTTPQSTPSKDWIASLPIYGNSSSNAHQV